MIALSMFAAFSPACSCFCIRSRRFCKRREVSQHELGIDDFDVANRINGRADVMNVADFQNNAPPARSPQLREYDGEIDCPVLHPRSRL